MTPKELAARIRRLNVGEAFRVECAELQLLPGPPGYLDDVCKLLGAGVEFETRWIERWDAVEFLRLK